MLVRVSVATTVAPGTAAPDESVTLPSSWPVTACARAADGTMRVIPSATARATHRSATDLRGAVLELRRIIWLPPFRLLVTGTRDRGAGFWGAQSYQW